MMDRWKHLIREQSVGQAWNRRNCRMRNKEEKKMKATFF